MRELAQRAGVALATLHSVELGERREPRVVRATGAALGMRPTARVADARATALVPGGEDFVHAAMGEFEARSLARPGVRVSIDEPYQHYQFAGRADVLAWDDENLLHIENRTASQPAGGRRLVQRQATVPRGSITEPTSVRAAGGASPT